MELLISLYEGKNDIYHMIDLMLWFAVQTNENLQELVITDPEKIKYVDEAEKLLEKYQEKLEQHDSLNLMNTLGVCRCHEGKIDKGMDIFLKAMEISIEIGDYEAFSGIYGNAKLFSKEVGNLVQYSNMKKLYKQMQEKISEVEEAESSEGEYAEIEYLANSLVKQAKDEEDSDEVISLYKKALSLLDKVPHGIKDQDDIYEDLGDIYISKLEEEELSDKEFEKNYEELINCLEKAYSINEKLQDYGRMIEIKNKLLDAYSKSLIDDEESWFDTFIQTKELALKTGNIVELCELFELAVPDCDPSYVFDDSNLDEGETYQDISNVLPFEELKQLYTELSIYFVEKRLSNLQKRIREGLSRYALRVNEPRLEEITKT
jgi:tetratricopeptide (TPR) repeat protein